MRKHLPAILLSLCILVLSTGVAMGSEAEWQIKWQEDGSLQEKVVLSAAQPIQNLDASWQSSSSGGQQIYSRTVKDWAEYMHLKDRLPIELQEKSFIVCKATDIKASSQVLEGSLYSSLKDTQAMELKIDVPGIIQANSADELVDHTAIWQIQKPGTVFNEDFALKAIVFDGWMLGISILSLGIIVMFLFFISRMRRVDRIIAETYSLDNIVIDDDEDETV